MRCPLPASHQERVPLLVSIVEERCEKVHNSLNVIYHPLGQNEKKKKFAVCSKGLGKDNIMRGIVVDNKAKASNAMVTNAI